MNSDTGRQGCIRKDEWMVFSNPKTPVTPGRSSRCKDIKICDDVTIEPSGIDAYLDRLSERSTEHCRMVTE